MENDDKDDAIVNSSVMMGSAPSRHELMMSPSISRRGSVFFDAAVEDSILNDRPSLIKSSSMSKKRHSLKRFDSTRTMGRLRSSFVGGSSQLYDLLQQFGDPKDESSKENTKRDTEDTLPTNRTREAVRNAIGQIPAILLIGMFHLMIGIPFGVSYFPVGWVSTNEEGGRHLLEQQDVNGPFPLPGKQAIGIRMFLFSTIMAQIVFTMTSKFQNPIGLQMVENVPFCHELAAIVISHQGYGIEALSTLMVIFGLSSILVGIVFYLLGKFNMGKIVYFFPTHVLVGCIGGIGLFLARTGIEVTLDQTLSTQAIVDHENLLVVVLFFEIFLRILEKIPYFSTFSLLTPIYFGLITPMFYIGLWFFQIPTSDAQDSGYFFPSLNDNSQANSSSWVDTILHDEAMFAIWKVIDLRTVSWLAVYDSIPTMIALILFSLIHVPINIPAFAISTNTEADMNNELVAHGYSNMIAGIFGGLQNYMAYTQSILYDRSGGKGRSSGIAVAAVTVLVYVVGPLVVSYIPRCMAGTLLIHIGLDLFVEGVYDSYHKYDHLEYFGIWLIVFLMIVYGMEAAMLGGVIAAISTYVVQNVTYLNPVRGSMSAVTLRSSCRIRDHEAYEILDNPDSGRSHIAVIQLQGHLFFGNIAQLTETIDGAVSNIKDDESSEEPWIIILDFSLVLGIDSSAAQALTKLTNNLKKSFGVNLCIFVAGSTDGFPCEFNLSEELSKSAACRFGGTSINEDFEFAKEDTRLLPTLDEEAEVVDDIDVDFSGSLVCTSLDLALIYAEDALLHKVNPSLLNTGRQARESLLLTDNSTIDEEREIAKRHLANLCVGCVDLTDVLTLFEHFNREVYNASEFIWEQGSAGDSAKILIRGTLIALIENEADTREKISAGNIIGELGLVQGINRMSSVQALTDAVVYSLDRECYEKLVDSSPKLARIIDLICVQYLANRVQHVSNRIFETRCLPI